MIDLNMLQGITVRLTALCKGDASTLAQWNEDIGFMRFLATNAALPKSADQIASELEGLPSASDTVMFAIRTIESDTLIGTIGFCEIEWSNQVAWLVMGIGDRSNWGKGYGTEALQLALRYAFHELNFHRLTLTVIAYNERAIALYEKMGFQKEGVFREFGLRDGKRYDMYLYGLLRSEWNTHV